MASAHQRHSWRSLESSAAASQDRANQILYLIGPQPMRVALDSHVISMQHDTCHLAHLRSSGLEIPQCLLNILHRSSHYVCASVLRPLTLELQLIRRLAASACLDLYHQHLAAFDRLQVSQAHMAP